MTESAGLLLTLAVGICAGFVRGLTGFGGPAFILAVLTLFFTPMVVVGKILIVEFIAGSYLLVKTWKLIRWKQTLALAIPTMATMPIGYQILTHTDPDVMRRLIAAATIVSCILMVAGWRYPKRLGYPGLIATGLIGGVVLGASYIALVVVAVILMGPYKKQELRGLFISWGWVTSSFFVVISVANGDTGLEETASALPLAVFYFAGTWLGSRVFQVTAEQRYRRYAIITLIGLSLFSLLQ